MKVQKTREEKEEEEGEKKKRNTNYAVDEVNTSAFCFLSASKARHRVLSSDTGEKRTELSTLRNMCRVSALRFYTCVRVIKQSIMTLFKATS